MKDYRPVLADILILLEQVLDEGKWPGAYTEEEVEKLIEKGTDMFNELDSEVEGGERF